MKSVQTRDSGPVYAVEEHEKRSTAMVLRHAALCALIRDMTMQTEVELFASMGDPAQTAAMMAAAQSYRGLGEFFVNPFVARLSDAYGRRPFLNLFPAYGVLANSLLSLDPMAKVGRVPLAVVHVALGGLIGTQSSSAVGTAALSDVTSGPDLGVALARMSGAFGAGTVLGPALGNQALKAGGFKAVYRLRALLALLHLVHNLVSLQETLPAAIPFSLQGLNPFGFLRLLTAPDRVLLSRLGRALLALTSEQKILINLKTLWLKESIGLTLSQAQNELMVYALAMWSSGGFFAPRLINHFGARRFSDFCGAFNAMSFAIWGCASSVSSLYLGLFLHMPGCNGTGASMVKADLFSRAGELGIGKAEMNGYLMSLRSVGVMIFPQLLGRLYVTGLPKGTAGQAWYVLSLCSALSLMLRK